jgi:hypothetical protein
MGFCEVLTTIFIVLKLIGVISCSWWAVFAPILIKIVFIVLCLIIGDY